MMERIHNNRQALILGVAVLFLLLLIPYMLIIRPQTEEVAASDGEIVRLQQENDIFQRKIDELTTEETSELSDTEIARKLPTDPNQEQVVIDLYNVGLATDVVLSNATFSSENSAVGDQALQSEASTSNQVQSIYVTANIKGSYAGIKSWMSAIQDLPRLTAVEQFTLSKPYVFNSTLLEATVTFTASYLPQTAASVDGPIVNGAAEGAASTAP